MTRRHVLAETLKLTGLLLGGVALLTGCEGGGGDESSSQAKLSEDRKAEMEKQRAATEAFAKEQASKKKRR